MTTHSLPVNGGRGIVIPEAPNERPLLARLIARTEKYQGCTSAPLANDITLHQQSVEEINQLTAENDRLRRFAERQRQVQDVPPVKNYAPFCDLEKPIQRDLDALVDQLRKTGLSIDGDNAYKRDLLDCVVGALACGAQNSNPPPSTHWATRFWEIGREERELHKELVAALKLTRENLRACQATIHLCGGFDPAYVTEAQAAMKIADAALAKAGA